jgi:site-specific recombinase XerD
LTKDEANHHLRRTLMGSKWEILHGWHTFRHSFISACASRGVDQRLVESWAGHMSKQTSRRYAHLYPSTQQQALASVFGEVA